MTTEPGIWAVILAAGESKRMNSPKLILPYGKTTMIGHLIDNILKSDINNILVVLGGWRDELVKAIEGLPVSSCFNDNYKSGMLSSVICGLDSLPPGTEAAMIFPGDQPDISPEIINSLIRSLSITDRGIMITVHEGIRGHPILIRKKFFAEVEKLDSGIGLRELLSKFHNEVYEVETVNKMVLRDIDTHEEYLNAINKS